MGNITADAAAQCGFDGNSDLYGLGLRVGLYLQFTAVFTTRFFIGYKEKAERWKPKPEVRRANLNLFTSSNQLFADYQPHNSNVFSIVDRFEITNEHGVEVGVLTQAKASYFVIGWQPVDGEKTGISVKDIFNFDKDGNTTRESHLGSL